MSLRHAILGFLSFRSLTGYDLKKAFDRSVRHFWPTDQSQIYRTLKQLDKEQLITKEVLPREDRPDVKVYSITEGGRQALDAWLSTPLPPTETREPFLIQLYFAFMLEDDEVINLLQAEIVRTDYYLQQLEKIYQATMNQETTEAIDQPMFYSMVPLEFGVQSARWYRGWLQSVKDRIAAGEMGLETFATLFNSENSEDVQ